jgi:hypothetical protein
VEPCAETLIDMPNWPPISDAGIDGQWVVDEQDGICELTQRWEHACQV